MKKRKVFAGMMILSCCLVLSLFGCQKAPDPSSTPTAQAATPTKATSAVTPTLTPALPTIEPGTEQYAEGILDAEKGTKAFFYPLGSATTGDAGVENQAPENIVFSAAVQFFPTTAFNKIGVRSPTWTATEGYTMFFELYAWAGSYNATLEGSPVAEGEISDWPDGEEAWFAFDPLPDGEYLLVMTKDGSAGLWYVQEAFAGQISYRDDEIWEDASIRLSVYYTKTPNKLYGPLSDPGLD